MPIPLVSEENVATKSKKTNIVVEKIEKVEKTEKVEKIERVENTEKVEKKVTPSVNPNVIVKRIYFPGDTYSKKENQTGFKKILSKYELTWYKPMMRTYTSKDGVSVLTGMYASADQNKKVFCIYEGTNKPATAIIKIMGSGGNFIIDLNSFCHGIGCITEDKDELFVNNTLLILQEKGEIYVEKKLEATKIEDYEKIFEEKVKKLVGEYTQKYVDSYKDTLARQGVSLDTALFFKKKDIEESVRWGLEHGFIKA